MRAESYSGTILSIDCRDKCTAESTEFLVPREHHVSRIRIENQEGLEHYELVRLDLPDSYVGRFVEVNNSTWRDESNGVLTERQEIVSRGGLEVISITLLKGGSR